jgi:hypothetical protein
VTQPLPNNEQLLRQHAADVIIITNALASAGSSGSTSRLQQKQGKIHLSFLFFYFNIFSYVLIGLGDLAPILKYSSTLLTVVNRPKNIRKRI